MLASRAAPRPAAPARLVGARPAPSRVLAPPPAATGAGPSAGLKELGAAVAAATGMSDKDGAAAVRAVLDAIEENVSKGVKVTVPGFGTFERKERAARVGRNPKTGAELQIAAKKYPAFSAGKTFKDKVAS